MIEAAALLRVLADPARLRLLRALSLEPLNVSELTAVLALAQSGVSRHLGLLRKLGVVVEEKRGTFTWYRLPPDAADPSGPRAPLWTWLHAEFRRQTPEARGDDSRLEEVRRVRHESFLQHGAGSEQRQFVPGRSWAAWSRALALLLPAFDVADLGCGEGYLTIETARWARHVVAIDRSAAVLARAQALAERRGVSNITWQRGDLDGLPLADASVDVAILSQALHHAHDPAVALAEACRVLRPGGRVLILDLRQHDQGWVRPKLGDRWLGFSEDALRRMLASAGFRQAVVRIGARRAADPFAVLVASAIRPLAPRRPASRSSPRSAARGGRRQAPRSSSTQDTR